MDKQTSEKLNDTLDKMGVMNDGNSPSQKSTSDSGQSSDMSFYIIMLALIVGMGFYISYDKEQRYGSDSSTATVASEATKEAALEPVVISIEKIKTVEIKPVVEIPATETTPAAVVVEKIEQKTVVTTAIIPLENIAPVVESAPTPVVGADPAPELVTPVSSVSSMMMPAMQAVKQAADVVVAPVVDAVEAVAETTDAVVAPIAQPAQAYNPYSYQYQQPQNNYYQQKPQYGNPYGNQNQYGNPYGNQYGNQNQYANPYGYGNNPYQQPAQ